MRAVGEHIYKTIEDRIFQRKSTTIFEGERRKINQKWDNAKKSKIKTDFGFFIQHSAFSIPAFIPRTNLRRGDSCRRFVGSYPSIVRATPP